MTVQVVTQVNERVSVVSGMNVFCVYINGSIKWNITKFVPIYEYRQSVSVDELYSFRRC